MLLHNNTNRHDFWKRGYQSLIYIYISTCHIQKILTIKQWDGKPNLSREFTKPSRPRFYNYCDYQRAQFNVFLIQNKDFCHDGCFISLPSINFPFLFGSIVGGFILVLLLRFSQNLSLMVLNYLRNPLSPLKTFQISSIF